MNRTFHRNAVMLWDIGNIFMCSSKNVWKCESCSCGTTRLRSTSLKKNQAKHRKIIISMHQQHTTERYAGGRGQGSSITNFRTREGEKQVHVPAALNCWRNTYRYPSSRLVAPPHRSSGQVIRDKFQSLSVYPKSAHHHSSYLKGILPRVACPVYNAVWLSYQ